MIGPASAQASSPTPAKRGRSTPDKSANSATSNISDEQTTSSRVPPKAASLPKRTVMKTGLNEVITPLLPSLSWISESTDRWPAPFSTWTAANHARSTTSAAARHVRTRSVSVTRRFRGPR